MPEGFNDWTLVSLAPWSAAWLWTAGTVLLLAVGVLAYSYRHSKRRALLITLRTLGALAVFFAFLEPAIEWRLVRRPKTRIPIVLDDSLSMGLREEGAPSRYDRLIALLRASKDPLQRLSEEHVVEWFDLAGATQPPTATSSPTREPTDLLSAIELATSQSAHPLGGVVLLSDGIDNVQLTSTPLSPAQHEQLASLGAPINTVMIGELDSFVDVAVTEVIADEFAFVHNTIEVEGRIRGSGVGTTTVTVTLMRDQSLIGTQNLQLQESEATPVKFRFKPDEIGEFVYNLRVTPVAGESILSNNEQSFVIRVVRDKIRVLHVAGKPSWDERFLRQHLKENPNVDLVSFFILRTPTDMNPVNDRELSLIPFPVDKLFTTELKSFDVVVFQDFDYRPYHMAQYLPNIRQAVYDGLAFIMIGGHQSFADGGYVGTALDELIPFTLDQAGVRPGSFTPTLTPQGKVHPVTDLARGHGSNARLWKSLPPWRAYNRVGRLVDKATPLVVEPQSGSPVVAVMEYGKGRSLAIASDSLWRWRFSDTQDGGTAERSYHRFWSNALRWLMRDPEHSRIQVRPTARRFARGESVDVRFGVKDSDYIPLEGAQLRATLAPTSSPPLHVDELLTGEQGTAEQRYAALDVGTYVVEADAMRDGKTLGQGRGVFIVEAQSRELADTTPRPELMQAIADATDGAFLQPAAELWDKLELAAAEHVEVDRRRHIELWDNAYALIFLILLLAAEWALRRRWGYF